MQELICLGQLSHALPDSGSVIVAVATMRSDYESAAITNQS